MIQESGGRARAAFIVLALVAAAAAGCATKNPYLVGSFERAAFFAEHKRYQEAADAFGVFVRQNPADSLAAEAQYRKAIAYMATKEYPLAAVEFQILQKDYPTSPLVADAMFFEGEAYLGEVGRLERDATGAYDARAHFEKFLRQYPDSPHVPAVQERLRSIADLLVRKRLQATEVYAKLGKWGAVALTLDHILAEEPASTLLDVVMIQRADSALRLQDPDTARRMYERVLAEQPASDLAARARDGLAALGPPPAVLP